MPESAKASGSRKRPSSPGLDGSRPAQESSRGGYQLNEDKIKEQRERLDKILKKRRQQGAASAQEQQGISETNGSLGTARSGHGEGVGIGGHREAAPVTLTRGHGYGASGQGRNLQATHAVDANEERSDDHAEDVMLIDSEDEAPAGKRRALLRRSAGANAEPRPVRLLGYKENFRSRSRSASDGESEAGQPWHAQEARRVRLVHAQPHLTSLGGR